jgi:hypothetical protein
MGLVGIIIQNPEEPDIIPQTHWWQDLFICHSTNHFHNLTSEVISKKYLPGKVSNSDGDKKWIIFSDIIMHNNLII